MKVFFVCLAIIFAAFAVSFFVWWLFHPPKKVIKPSRSRAANFSGHYSPSKNHHSSSHFDLDSYSDSGSGSSSSSDSGSGSSSGSGSGFDSGSGSFFD